MSWNPPFSIWVILAFGCVALFYTARSVYQSEALVRRGARLPVFLLRSLAIATLLLILINPSRRGVANNAGTTTMDVVLVDGSKSMGLEQPISRFEQGIRWSQELADGGAAGMPCRIFGFGDDIDFEGKPKLGGASTRLGFALRRLLESNPEQRIANIVIVSDGRIHDHEELTAALSLARQLRVPVSTYTVGSNELPRNVYVRACRVDRTVPAGTKVNAEIEVGSTGLQDGTELEITVADATGKVLADAAVTVRSGVAAKKIQFESGLRSTEYTVAVKPVADELLITDNRFSFTLDVADPKIRILYFEGSNDVHGKFNEQLWNYNEYMINAWRAAGDIQWDMYVTRGRQGQYQEGKTLAYVRGFDDQHRPILDGGRTLPSTRDEWFGYDVIICSDVLRDNFTPEQLQWTVDFVTERGGGFCMIGGNTSFDTGKWDQTIWEKIIPVDMLEFGFGHQWRKCRPAFPDAALHHAILQLDSDPEKNRRILEVHPVFLGFHDIRRPKPGATVLAVRDGTSAPLITVQDYGKGRSMAFLSDSAGGWGEEYQNLWGPGLLGEKKPNLREESESAVPNRKDNDYYCRFWVNSVRWLAEKSVRRHNKDLLGRTHAISYQPGETIKVSASLLNILDPDTISSQSVGARLALDGQSRVVLTFDRDRKEFVGELKLPETVEQSELFIAFDAPGKESAVSDNVRIRVMRNDQELENPLPDPQLMADIAKSTGGAVVRTTDEARIAMERNRHNAAKENLPYSEPLWNHFWLWLGLLGVISVEWTVRKFASA